MGTQQILMIILSVIVVGTAIAIGIQMFDTQLENSTRQTLAIELVKYASDMQSWYRIPASMGGGGNGKNANGVEETYWPDRIVKYAIDWNATGSWNTGATLTNLNGTFFFTTTTTRPQVITILATSAVNDNIQVQAVFPLSGGSGDITITQM